MCSLDFARAFILWLQTQVLLTVTPLPSVERRMILYLKLEKWGDVRLTLTKVRLCNVYQLFEGLLNENLCNSLNVLFKDGS